MTRTPVIAVAFISDRPPALYLREAVATFHANVAAVITHETVIDDRAHRLGMAGAVQAAWTWADEVGATHLWHIEEDFRFMAPVETGLLVELLDRSPYLASVTLTRGPWSAAEHAAGSIAAQHPSDYAEMIAPGGGRWLRHRRIFSLNPSLIPRRTFADAFPAGYPSGPLGVGNEAGATRLLVEQGRSFALWGGRDDPPQVEHIGQQRGDGWKL